MKIFEIITSVHLGGAENFTFNLIEQCTLLHPVKFEFIVVELYPSKSFYALRKKAELRSKGIRIITLSPTNKRWGLVIAPIVLFSKIRKEKPQIIHSHTDLPDFVLSVVLKFCNLKTTGIVRTIHNTELWGDHFKIGKFVEKSFIQDQIIGVSVAAKEAYISMRNRYCLPVSDFSSVIYNGCSIPGKDIHYFKIDKSKINIAFCGRLVYQKGIDILTSAIKNLDPQIRSKFLFHIVGDGPFREDVMSISDKFNNVIFYGSVSNLSEKLYDFDYLLIPSRFEGLSLISVESSMSNVPVVPANIPGLNETIPKDWPFLFNIDEQNGIEKILTKIASLNFDNERLKQIAFDFVSDRFCNEKMGKLYSSIYSNYILK